MQPSFGPLIGILLIVSASGSAEEGCVKHRMLKSDKPVELAEADGASLILARAVSGMVDCQFLCGTYSCDLATFSPMERLCRLLRVFPGPLGPGGSAIGSFGSEDGELLWLVEAFQQRLQDMRDSANTVTNGTFQGEFQDSSSSRNGSQQSAAIPIPVANGTFLNSSIGRNGSVQSAAVPQTGCYRIEALGASGGSVTCEAEQFSGGRGAAISGFFNLTEGAVLSIVVGQQGSDGPCSSGSGGGGGSFVYYGDRSELLLAAGGGGGAAYGFDGSDGQDGVNGTDSTGLNFWATGFGGANGQPGLDMSTVPCESGGSEACRPGGPGAGWIFNASAQGRCGGNRGDGWIGGGELLSGGFGGGGGAFGGSGGGFGGGGGAFGGSGGGAFYDPNNINSLGGSGGGGGFSGGGSGTERGHAGGGGGSFCSGGRCIATAGGSSASEHGRVVVTAVGSENCCCE